MRIAWLRQQWSAGSRLRLHQLRGPLHNAGADGRCEQCGEPFPCPTGLAVYDSVKRALEHPALHIPRDATTGKKLTLDHRRTCPKDCSELTHLQVVSRPENSRRRWRVVGVGGGK